MSRLLIGTTLLLVAHVSPAAYITDKLLAGFYASPDLTSEPIRALPNSTPMEVLEEKGNLSRIRLGDNSEGWVETRYITQEKPTRTMLLELQAKYAALKRQADNNTPAQQTEVSAPAPTTSEAARLAQAQQRIQQLQKIIAEQDAAPDSHADEQQQRREKFKPWALPLLMLGLLLSFVGGIAFKNYRIVRRTRQESSAVD